MSETRSGDGLRPPDDGRSPWRIRLTRRGALRGAAAVGIGAGLGRLAAPADAADALARTVPFHGAHQAGIVTPQQDQLAFAAFDVASPSRAALRDLLQRWTQAALDLTAGREYAAAAGRPDRPPPDPGEALGLAPASLTLTFGFGPGLFRDGSGLEHLRPPALEPLPAFAGDALDPARSGGDLCVQACADDPQVAFHAVHVLARVAGDGVVLRWLQHGFRPRPSRGGEPPRNLLGFKDGTANIRGGDAAATDRFVWVRRGDGPGWLEGGTYLVARRIELVLESWDAVALSEQERAIGRRKRSGDALVGSALAADAHIRVAGPGANGGLRILRRGYSFSDGSRPGPLDRGGHQLASGLVFVAFVRDPGRQFVPLQRRLSTGDALSMFTQHTGSALFACPPGTAPGGFVGEQLFA